MKCFKVKASRMAERYKITSEEFIKRTERKKPFEQCTSGSALSQFGLCPSCLNPIQLLQCFFMKKLKRAARCSFM